MYQQYSWDKLYVVQSVNAFIMFRGDKPNIVKPMLACI